MDFTTYQQLSSRTLKTGRSMLLDLQDYSLGLLAEGGEAFDVLKKHLYHGHILDVEKLSKESGDQLWYAAALCTTLGLSMEQALTASFVPHDKNLHAYPPLYFWPAAQLSNQILVYEETGDESQLEGAKYFLGDCIAVTCIVLKKLGINPAAVLAANVEKLRQRYPEGYSDAASITRTL